MTRTSIWALLRRLTAGGGRKSPVTDSALCSDPAGRTTHTPAAGQRADPAGTSEEPGQRNGEAVLRDVVSACTDSLIKPVLRQVVVSDERTAESTTPAGAPLAAGLLCLLALCWLLAVVGSSLARRVAALAAPGVRSARALERHEPAQRRRWLRYWAVYGVVSAVSTVTAPLHQLLPGYTTAETLLLLWCAAPYPWHGTDYVLERLIVPAGRAAAAAVTGAAAAETEAEAD